MAHARRQRRGRVSAHVAPSDFEELLSLQHIRDRLGDKWPLLQQNVFKLAGKLIELHKFAPTAFTREAENFRLTFRCSSQDEAQQRTLEIAAAIDKAIFGQPLVHGAPPVGTYGDFTARSRSGRWGLSRLLKRFTSWLISGDSPASTAGQTLSASNDERATLSTGASASPAFGLGDSAVLMRSHPAGQSGLPSGPAATHTRQSPQPMLPAVDAAAVPSARSYVAANSSGSVPLGQAPESIASSAEVVGAPTSQDEISAIEALLVQEGDRLASEQEELVRAAQFPPNDLQCVYRPMWSVKTSMLGLSTCFPACIRHGTELCVGYGILPEKYTSENVSFLDELVLRHVVEQCCAVEATGRPPLIMVPVHYENLSDPDRLARYRALCEEIPGFARRFLSFELWGIGEAYGHQQIISILSTLRRYSSLQFGNLSCGQATLTFWKTAGLHGIGINIDDWRRQHAVEKELIEALERFRLCAYRSGLRSYARGITSRSIALACVAAGYDFLDGTVIQRHLEPTTVSRFGLSELYGLFSLPRE